MIEMYTEQELREQLYTHWVNGVRVRMLVPCAYAIEVCMH